MRKIFLIQAALISLLFCCCETEKKDPRLVTSRETIVDTASGSCPYLTKDTKGNIVLGWIRQLDSTTFVFCYAISTDQGQTFGQTVEVPASRNVHPHGENMPKIVFKPNGEIIAMWGAANPNPKNPYSGMVFYSQSFDNGNNWSKATTLTKEPASIDQRYFDLALLPDGEAAVVWLDNRKTSDKEGSGLYYAVTTGKGGFQSERLISEPCCPCCRTDLFIDRQKNVHVLYRGIVNDTIRDMVHIVSTNGGQSFSNPERISKDNWVISGCPHTGPAMAENKEGLHFTWFTGGEKSGIYYTSSQNNGKSFATRDSVSGKSAKHCQIAALANDDIAIVWNEGFVEGKNFSNRIGIEVREQDNHSKFIEYITEENSNSSFPVLCPVNAEKVVVAYTESIKGKDQILFRQVRMQ